MVFNFRLPIFILTYQIGNGFQAPFTHIRFNAPTLPTPVRPDKLALWLEGHPLAQKVLSYFTVGCSLKACMTEPPPHPRNHKSARQNAQLVSAKIDKELAAGHLTGPFHLPPFSKFVVSPLGLVPKKDGGQRLIHDLVSE